MKKKIVVLVAAVILAMVGVYFGYKAFCLNYYRTSIESRKFTIKEPYELKKITLKDDEYFKVQNIMIKDVFGEFVKEDYSNGPTKEHFFEAYSIKENDKIKARVSFNKALSLRRILENKENSSGNSLKVYKEAEKYMKTKHFASDFEFLKFLSEYKEQKINIFTPVKDMRKNFVVRNISSLYVVDSEMQELKGDESGYILKNKVDDNLSFTEVNIERDDYKYTIYFLEKNKVVFTDEVVDELIKSIKIS